MAAAAAMLLLLLLMLSFQQLHQFGKQISLSELARLGGVQVALAAACSRSRLCRYARYSRTKTARQSRRDEPSPLRARELANKRGQTNNGATEQLKRRRRRRRKRRR